MYTVGNVIYGIPLSTDLEGRSEELEIFMEDLIEDESSVPGGISYYSGAGVDPIALGVELCEFDETSNFDVSTLVLKATPAQIAEFTANFAKIEPTLRTEIVKLFGSPREFILWSTS